MSAISRAPAAPPEDPRVARSRAAVVAAATALFLEKGYASTTMEEIALRAGLTKRTVYNNYGDKQALFTEVVADVITLAETFAHALADEFRAGIAADNVGTALHDLGRRMALGILRPDVIALRRLLIREAPAFPDLTREYFDRAPGRVLAALAEGFARMHRAGVLDVDAPRQAAEQFAYLVAGAPLDRAMLVGVMPPRAQLLECARQGVETFLARYSPRVGSPQRGARRRQRAPS